MNKMHIFEINSVNLHKHRLRFLYIVGMLKDGSYYCDYCARLIDSEEPPSRFQRWIFHDANCKEKKLRLIYKSEQMYQNRVERGVDQDEKDTSKD